MKLNAKQLLAVALAGACLAVSGSYAASAEDAAVDPATDPEVVAMTLSGELATPPPVDIIVAPGEVTEPAYASPEEEDVTANVNVNDPGPVMPADPGVADSLVVANVGAAPDAASLAGASINSADGSTPGGGGECSASAAVPTKQEMRIWGTGSVSCGTTQRSLNVVVCLDYRNGGVWEQIVCKPKTVSQAKSTSKKASTPCVPGRFLYRTRVYGAATAQNGARASIPERTAVTGGRIPCAS